MPQSLARVWIHLTFSTKGRCALLKDDDVRDEMWRMLGHHAHEAGCPTACVGGWHDHAHVLCGLSRTVTIAGLVEVLKRESSKWAKQRWPLLSRFAWQNGYGAFSVSQSLVDQVVRYIQRQPIHHQRSSYMDEFRALCIKHGLEIDERYVWD